MDENHTDRERPRYVTPLSLEIGAAHLRSVIEIAPKIKSSFLCVNTSPLDPVWFSCRRKSYPV